jgi:pyruvate/2-oxoglutarate dehydrogenase complex dihydrolipoamide dehydrogenase (E3) component
MAKFQYNAVVIGGGTAGLISANVMAQAKAKVALFEKHLMGGDCLNTGCVPSKTLIASSKVMKLARQSSKYGIKINGDIEVDFPAIMRQVQESIDFIAPIDSRERYRSLGVDCFEDDARILGPHEVGFGNEKVTTQHIVIASGASPVIPLITGLADMDCLHSNNLWGLKELPRRLLVVGSGPIGCELAQAFANLGSKVTMISNDRVLLAREEPDVSAFIQQRFIEDGIELLLEATLNKFVKEPGHSILEYTLHSELRRLEFDRVIVAVGRKANTVNLGLEALGVAIAPNGTVKVNDYLQTSVSNVWACGDVAGPYQFTHMAAHQAGYVAMNILASPFKKFAVNYSQVPWVTYTDPEIGRLGLSVSEATAKSIAFEVTEFDFSHQDRAITERENRGFIKVISAPKTGALLGVTIVGPGAGELLAEFSLALKNGLTLKHIAGTIHPYPTLSEANKSVALAWRKKSIPVHLLAYAARYFAWRRR